MSLFSILGIVAILSGLLSGWGAQHWTAEHYRHLIDKQAAEQREALDKANVNAQAAAELYEEAKQKTRIKVVTVTKEVSHAVEAAPSWSMQPLPDQLRESIAAASAALAASEPDGAVRLPAAGGAEQRPVGDGLHPSLGGIGRLFGKAPRLGAGG